MNFYPPIVAGLRSTIRRAAMVIAILMLSLFPVDAPKDREGMAAEPAGGSLSVGGLPVT